MKLTDVIRRPLITEKTTILREDGRTIVFEVATRREQDRDQARGREAARLEGRQRPHRASRTARSSGRAGSRPPLGLEEGLREAARRREDARVPGRGVSIMPIRKYKPTSPGRRFQTVQTFDEITTTEPHKPLVEPLQQLGRPQQPRRADVVVARRRPQADLPHHRLQARQARHPGEGRRRSSTTRTARRASRCVTYADGEKRYILQPLGLKVGDTIVAGRQRRHPAGQLRCR